MNTLHRSLILTSVIGSGVLISACVSMPGPKAGQANLAIPKRYDASQAPVPEVASGLRSLFPDSRMNAYVSKALKANPDLRASAAQLEEAGFNTRKAYSLSLPSLTGNGSGSRADTLSSSTTGSYSASLDVQWELDVWGRIRAGVTAAAGDRAAAEADYAAARQSIAAQTMQAYFSLVGAEKLLALSNRRLASFQQTLDLVNRRFEAGTGDLSEVELARTDVENTRAQVAQRKDSRDQAARNLATLTGAYPNAQSRAYSWPSLRRSVPAGIPSDVLLNRPDIDAAYQRIRAADSRVKVAHRDLYPSFSLTASAGQQSSTLRNLANSNFSVWSFAGNLSAPLLDGGNRRAELGAANARAKQALAAYQSTVLDAFKEVENALGSERYLSRQQNSYQSALKAAKNAEEQILRNYETGLVEILTLLDSQRRSFDTEESLINTQALRYQNRVSLALALGKGL
ncbi:efflux transporter outer membrane subunit [Verrucomicrobiaceae bacterium 5K15]|uniref:Efflux transporter outer membrane subunit n=1 Tax=Oceaniferula flava TaxID=2800421 RepID=A0AAE2S9M1_9BACT|nr:efflux transporter outer membrane subunit [Oceaniferula flavus]MBK1853910.1 efflux transporter outer membrane subunit [Oceaniferula flavus]MBM1135216.1 efflux transporter outer membrane subunit [Oceaniferula flavus]